MDRQRSQMLLDIEHDLSLIKDRLSKLEDHFESDGIIDQIAQTIHRLVVQIEQLIQANDAGAK